MTMKNRDHTFKGMVFPYYIFETDVIKNVNKMNKYYQTENFFNNW